MTRPVAAVKAELAGIPALRAEGAEEGTVSLLRQEIIDRRQDRLLDELWAGMSPAARAAAAARTGV